MTFNVFQCVSGYEVTTVFKIASVMFIEIYYVLDLFSIHGCVDMELCK